MGIIRWGMIGCGSVCEVKSGPDIDTVYIAAPPDSHREYALFCAEQRKPAYIERLLGRTWEDCAAIARAFRATKTPVFTSFY